MTMKGKRRNKSGELVASIDDDVLTQILIKVPIKPLIRFKLVCKHWLSLISTHEFSILRNPNPNPPLGFFVGIKTYQLYRYNYFSLYPNNPDSFVPSINFGFTTAPIRTVILHSCNGLLLCCSSQKWVDADTVLEQPDCKMYVYNPTTNSSIALPHLPDFNRKWATLAFDPVKSSYYKVVLIVVGKTYEIQIYSSETGHWSHGCEIGMERCDDVRGSGVYWNGSIHWLNDKFATRNPRNSIKFHVSTRVIGEMPSPPVVINKTYMSNVYFGESCDHLHFVEYILPRFNVYEMKRDYSEWYVKYKVDLSPFIKEYPEVIRTGYRIPNLDLINVVSLIRVENGKEAKLVLRIPNGAIKYNLDDGTWEKLCDIVHDKFRHMVDRDENGVFLENFKFDYQFGLDYIQSLCGV